MECKTTKMDTLREAISFFKYLWDQVIRDVLEDELANFSRIQILFGTLLATICTVKLLSIVRNWPECGLLGSSLLEMR